MSPVEILTLAVLAVVGIRLTDAARHSLLARSHVVHLVRGLRLRHFALAVPVLVTVISLALVLFQVPGLHFGWWTAIGGQGNPVFGQAPAGTGPSTGVFEVLVPSIFAVLLLIGLPAMVEGEEWAFRRGAEHRSRPANLRRAVLFGLVHALIGIPIGAALALSAGGLYFTWAYLRVWRATGSAEAALDESTRCHLAYNLVIVGVVVLALAAGW